MSETDAYCLAFMPFDPVDPRQSFPALEQGVLAYWREEDLFRRSIEERKGGPTYSFYDGPPFATGLPHYGHLLAGTIKDVIPRYQTMRGNMVERRFGWDCHGLPIENLIEKEHGIRSKRDIEAMGVEAFNALCRASVQRYTKEWRTVVERMGRWVDMDFDYRTMDPNYMESIWWVLRTLYDRGLVYEGHKPMHVCPRCSTPLSNFEVTQGYKEVTDLGVTVKFKVKGTDGTEGTKDTEEQTYFLAWTTTAWTLPGNVFLAVHPEVSYVRVRSGDALYIVAKDRVETVFKDHPHTIVGRSFKGTSLVGTPYEPPFPYFADQYGKDAFTVAAGDFVTTAEGTGIVHIAPGFGEDDFNLWQREINSKKTSNQQPATSNLALLQHVTMEGRFVDAVTDFAGMEVKPTHDPSETDRRIAQYLEERGKLFLQETTKHSYPHCWRCDTPLLNYACSSWFVAVEKIKDQLLTVNEETEWVPAHVRSGRFGKWLEGARDWAISRARYWGTPLPIWRSAAGDLEVIGSRDDLMARNLIRFTKITVLRHGESEGNTIPLYQGVPPGTSLTERGRKQAEEAAACLQDSTVAAIYTSPLARARQTADIVAGASGATVIVDERLCEVSFGAYEGKTIDFSDLSLIRAKRAKKISDSSPESVYHFPGMETWQSVQERIHDFLRDTLPKHRSSHIVIVTHADPIVNMRHFFTKEDPVKLSHQPFPAYAVPQTFFWDHDTDAELDLHRETVDTVTWAGSDSPDSVELTMVRHGETDFNRENRVQGGDSDLPLNASGRAQAEQIAKQLKKKSFEIILTSNRKRTMETAEIIGRALGIATIEPWDPLTERYADAWAGRLRDDVYAEVPPHPGCEAISWHYATPPGGESLSKLLKRAERACEEILRRFPGKRVLMVTHRGVMLAIRTIVENRTYSDSAVFRIKNTEALTLTLHPRFQRVPDVLDCWFESGAMPYASTHYPFETNKGVMVSLSNHDTDNQCVALRQAQSDTPPPGFPADFIAEGIDQTRGWFYTLLVLSTALCGKPAFKHCIVNGIVLAEDGRKMSKRLQNYPEPTEIMQRYGADAMRFALMSSPAVRGEELRFSKRLVEDTVRSVLLPLWNAYSFFTTYANAAGFEPLPARTSSPHSLDRMIRAEVQDLANRMTTELDRYDLSATCRELHETIDVLTNWYIRLSRRRFAGKASLDAPEVDTEDHEEDREHALTTLYDVLLTLSQLLAPLCPFLTEAIYLNLVPKEHSSIHLTDWPLPRPLSKDERSILTKMRLLRTIVSLGMKVRAEQRIPLRQPLSKAIVAVPPAREKESDLSDDDRLLLRQELNVKELEFTDDPSTIGERIVQINARVAGPRLGAGVQEIIAAGKRGEFTETPQGIIVLEELLTPDEAHIVYRGHEVESTASQSGTIVRLSTHLTPALKAEGQVRDLIRTIQQRRKEAGLSIRDRIALEITGADDLLKQHGALIAQETNAVLSRNDGEQHTLDLGERSVTIRFQKTTHER